MKVKTIIEMDYQELDKLVNKHIPSAKGEYEFIAEQEANNDSSYNFNGINGKFESELDKKYSLPSIEAGELRSTDSVLNYLCKMGVIPAGDYLINVCW